MTRAAITSILTTIGVMLVMPLVVSAGEPTYIKVTGPNDRVPGYILDVGNREWRFDGTAIARIVEATPYVATLRASDCSEVYRFTVQDLAPGDGYELRLDARGEVKRSLAHGFADGPFLLPNKSDACALPPTDELDSRRGVGDGGPNVLAALLVGGLTFVAASLRFARRRPTRSS